ncbi:ATP-binding protein [Nostoc sp. FACHB-110]|uniref:ATP-binding response regulator n=1 Tax=Nostoc sp. FACHB-110 TaxID=2692834 RepID=UPI001683B44B|nr:ATP-binding protein [Nostoc sp. FACHB-110]MBD2436060.1 response regulator [Nostoc sp. FACHB-110]
MTRAKETKSTSQIEIGSRQLSIKSNLNTFSRRTLALKWHLVLLVAGTLLPVVLFAVAVVHQLSLNERGESERRLALAARNLTQEVEREVAITTRTLQALAASNKIDQNDLQGFYHEAKRTVQTQPTWLSAILLTPDEQQVLNTSRPFGTALPSANEPESVRLVVQTHQPTVGYLALSRLKHQWAFPVRVPVMRNGKLRYVLTAIITSDAIASIERNAKAQSQLVNDLLDTSRIIVGKLRLEAKPLNLATVIMSAIDAIRHAAEAKNIDLQLQLANVEPVLGDQNRLQQVVWNLLSNAVKFTPEGGRIAVELQQTNSMAEIIVSDTGIGIKPEFLPYVFDRFRQADGSTTREFGGLGLGLAIVRHLVELHGGTVQADSKGIAQGSTFTIKLPLITRQQSSDSFLQSVDGQLSLGKSLDKLQDMRVLVVDDEPDARDLLSAVLIQQGAEVRTCASAAEAIQAVFTWKPTAILCDIGMPQEDGYDFIRKVREQEMEIGSHIPAVAVTAFAREEDKIKAIACGYEMHIPKPLEPTQLVAVVASLAHLSP